MSDQLINVPRERYEQLAAAPLQLAQLEAAEMVRRGDVAGATRHLQAAVAQSTTMQAQIQAQQQAPPPPQPVTPAAPAAVAPLAAPATPLPHYAAQFEAMQRYRPQGRPSATTAEDLAAATSNMGLPMGLKPLRR